MAQEMTDSEFVQWCYARQRRQVEAHAAASVRHLAECNAEGMRRQITAGVRITTREPYKPEYIEIWRDAFENDPDMLKRFKELEQ